jgi:adenylate cyclase
METHLKTTFPLVNEQLDRILVSDEFKQSTVLCNFLHFIVKETLEGNGPNLKEYTIGLGALGKRKDFNPQIDAIVRIHAGRLRRQLKVYYDTTGKNDPLIIEMVKGSYMPFFHTHRKSEQNHSQIPQIQLRDHRKLTIGILPFRNLCADNTFQYFTEGFGEELTRMFSMHEELDVIAYHSMRMYQENPKDVRMIGKESQLHYLVSGNVMRNRDEIRVSAGLIEVIEGHQIWSKVYTHQIESDNLFDIQQRITEDIFATLGDYYGHILRDHSSRLFQEKKITLHAFDSAVWHYYFHMTFTQETYTQTVSALESAVKENPQYATGYAMLSNLYLDGMALGFNTVKDPILTASDLATKAVNLNSECQYAQIAVAWSSIVKKKKQPAIEAIEKAVLINPQNIAILGTSGFGMVCAGEYERGQQWLERSIMLNPNCPWWFYLGFSLIYYKKGEIMKAGEYAMKMNVPEVYLDLLMKIITFADVNDSEYTTATFRKRFPLIIKDLPMHLATILLDTDLIDMLLSDFDKINNSNFNGKRKIPA